MRSTWIICYLSLAILPRLTVGGVRVGGTLYYIDRHRSKRHHTLLMAGWVGGERAESSNVTITRAPNEIPIADTRDGSPRGSDTKLAAVAVRCEHEQIFQKLMKNSPADTPRAYNNYSGNLNVRYHIVLAINLGSRSYIIYEI